MDKRLAQILSAITLVIGILIYSLMGFAYVHNQFTTKGTTKRIETRQDRNDEQLLRIENKVDTILERI